MKRIVFTVTNDLIYDQRMQRICGSLTSRGYDCLLVGRLLPSSKKVPNFPFNTQRLKCHFNKGKFFYLEYNIRLFFFLMSYKTDVVCAIDLDTILPCTFYARLKNLKLVYDAHEYFTEVPEVVNRPLIKSIWHKVAKYCIPMADACYTVGPKLAEIIGRAYGKKFSVVRNVPVLVENDFPSIKQKNDLKKSERGYLLYQGALNEGRGLEELIIAAKNIPIKILIAGEGDLSAKLRNLVKKENVENVEFLGFLEPKDLKKITAGALLGYNLLENRGLSYYYSLANKFFDYAAAGVPCLISPFPEYLSLNSTYNMGQVAQLNANDIGVKVNALLQNQDHYEELSLNCIKAAKELNWQKEEQNLYKVYDGLYN